MRDHVQAPPNKSQEYSFLWKNIRFPNSLYLDLKLRDEDVPDSGDGGNKDVPEEDSVEDKEEAAKAENDTNEDNIENKIDNNEPNIPSSQMKENPDLAGGSSRQEVIHQISRPVHPSSRQEVKYQLTRLVHPSSLKEENHHQARPVPPSNLQAHRSGGKPSEMFWWGGETAISGGEEMLLADQSGTQSMPGHLSREQWSSFNATLLLYPLGYRSDFTRTCHTTCTWWIFNFLK